MPTSKFVTTTTLDIEVNYYLLESLLKPKSKTLYSIWIGGNDYLFDHTSNINSLTTNVVKKVSWAVKTLAFHGAKKFLILNLPDLSVVPYGRVMGNQKRLQILSTLHNQKLANEVKLLRAKYPHIQIVYADLYSVFNEFLTDPDGFNKKYNTHITNTIDSCWHGGYMLPSFGAAGIKEEIQQTLIKDPGAVPAEMDADAISMMLVNSPEIIEAFRVASAFSRGAKPCQNPEEYVFWDQIHPTEVVNRVISQVVVKQLTAELPDLS